MQQQIKKQFALFNLEAATLSIFYFSGSTQAHNND